LTSSPAHFDGLTSRVCPGAHLLRRIFHHHLEVCIAVPSPSLRYLHLSGGHRRPPSLHRLFSLCLPPQGPNNADPSFNPAYRLRNLLSRRHQRSKRAIDIVPTLPTYDGVYGSELCKLWHREHFHQRSTDCHRCRATEAGDRLHTRSLRLAITKEKCLCL